MPIIDFTSEVIDSVFLVKFDWEFTNDNASAVFDRILQQIKENWKFKIIMNMQNIDTINSRAAGGFARIYEHVDDFWWVVCVCNMNIFIEDTLDLLWMFLFLSKAKTEQEALISINK